MKEEIKLAKTISKPKPKKVINKPKKQYTKNTMMVVNQTKPWKLSMEDDEYPT